MKRTDPCKTLSAAALMGGMIVTASALAQSQGGNAGSGMMGGYGGGMWLPLLVVIAVAGIVAWLVSQERKGTSKRIVPLTPDWD